MNNILLIGGSGFIGGHLAERLCQKGAYNVSALVRKTSDTKLLESLNVKLIQGDLLEPETLPEALKNIDTVYCMVEINSQGMGHKQYLEALYQLHNDGTMNLLEACKAQKVRRIIYFSSTDVYAFKVEEETIAETASLDPFTALGKAKLKAELLIHDAAEKGEIDYTILRPSIVFGERNPGVIGKYLPAIKRRFIALVGGGEYYQNYTYVGNVCNQAILVGEKQSAIGETYNVTEKNPYTLNDLIDSAAEHLKIIPLKVHAPVSVTLLISQLINMFGKFAGKKIIDTDKVFLNCIERIYDGSKIFEELGYEQEYDLEASVLRTVDSLNA